MIKSKFKSRNFTTVFTLCNLLLFTFFLSSCSSPSQPSTKRKLPILGHKDVVNGDTVFHTIPDWKYLTQDSVYLSSKKIDNHIWVVDFIFSMCKKYCSPMTYAMNQVNDSLNAISNQVTFLSFSIDPNHDTPSVLKKYIADHDVSAKNWYFLTGGKQKQINQFAINQFLIFAASDKDAPGGFAHSQNFVLVDQHQRIRGLYNGLTKDGRHELIKDAKTLAHQ